MVKKMNFDEINDLTGFANGDKFKDEGEVIEYFRQENMERMFGTTHCFQVELAKMAETVIENKWHME